MATVVMLILVGAVLLVLETVLPGLVAGIFGACCVVAGVVLAYVEFGARTGNWVLLVVVVGGVAGLLLYLRYFPQSRAARLFVSQRTVGDIGTERPELMRQIGTAATALRPSGVAAIAGQRVDVVSEGPLIERGTAVRVVAVEGARVVVRALEPGETFNSKTT